MKTNWAYKFFKYLKKVYFRNDKRVAAYLVCVVIATFFWFLNALSKTYTLNIVAPVSYVNLPNNKTLAGKLPDRFDLKIRAHGFTILRHKLLFLVMPLEFDVNEMTNYRMRESRQSDFSFPSRQFLSELSYQMSNDIEILNMDPDTLVFRFDKMGQKRVKVKPLVQINLKKQYQISDDMITLPDSVIVNGPQSALDTLQFVTSELHRFNAVEEPVHEKIRIKPIKGLFFEPRSVELNIPVEEYTEAQQSVPLILLGQPADLKVKLFPSKVKVSFLVGLSRFSEIHPEDFKLTVSYTEIKQGKQRLKVTAESTPTFLYDLKISPVEVEYLIEHLIEN